MKKSSSKLDVIKDLTQKLLDLLEIKASFTIEEKEDIVGINIQTDSPGLLIGYHGEALSSFQLILSMIVWQKLGQWTRILVDVGDYRDQRKKALERIALSAAQKVKFSGKEYEFSPMSANERRIIHLVLSDNPDVLTESKGEGKERRIVVKPKSK